MVRVLLDTQQWNYLVFRDEYGMPSLNLAALAAAQESGVVEVLGSLDLLQELLGVYRKDPARYDAVRSVFERLVGQRILRPLSQRHQAELAYGGLLPLSRAFFERADIGRLQRILRERSDLEELVEEVHKSTTAFRDEEMRLRAVAQARIDEQGGGFTEQRAIEWYRQLNMEDWVDDSIAAGGERDPRAAPAERENIGIDRYPSAYTFTAVRLAQIAYQVGGNRRIQPSDLADAHHLACGPYVDVIVSDDGGLLRVYDLMASRVPFRVVSAAVFVRECQL